MNKEVEMDVLFQTIDRGINITGEYDIECNMICGVCNEVVGDYESETLWCNYCPNCGQKLKYTKED